MPGPTIKLSSGHEMPQVGFGLWKVDNAIASDTVYNAIKAGYRLLDGACGKKTSPAGNPYELHHHVVTSHPRCPRDIMTTWANK
jgi:hypothetical protein